MKETEEVKPYSPSYWGSSGWRFLHAITLTYPLDPTPEDKALYTELFSCTGRCLPCGTCSDNFIENTKNNPIRLNTRVELVDWLVQIHNMVNLETGKPIMSTEDMLTESNISSLTLYIDD